MNEATKLGLDATNNARQAGIAATAQQKISYILEERAKIASYEKSKSANQEALAKLAVEVVTYQDVTGASLPLAPNQNQATIIKAVEAINSGKQKQVECASKGYIDNISSYDHSIVACGERIKALNEELNKLGADIVTEAQVVA